MQIKVKKKSFSSFSFENIIIVLGILVSKSLYYETFGQNILLVLILGLVFLNVFYKTLKKEFYISKKSILLYLLIVLIVFINPNKAMSTSLVFTTALTIALFFTNSIPLSHFTRVFYKFTKFIMIASLFRYFFIFTNIPSFLPDFVSIIGDSYENFIFFGIPKAVGTYFGLLRNNGLWWEPGAFQVIINLAFLLGLLFKNVTKKDYFLFLFVILTTLSTAGILIFSILSFIYFSSNLNYKLIVFFLLLIAPIISLSSYYQDYYQNVIVNKLDLENPSANSRFNDATLALRLFSAYPVIGTGMGNVEIFEEYKEKYKYGTRSNGVLNLLAYLGILSIVIFIPVFYPGYLKKLDRKEKSLASISLVLIFFTQNFTAILIFPLLIFYGASKYKLSDFQSNLKAKDDLHGNN